MTIDKQLEISVSDTIIEKPLRFNVGEHKFNIYPSTLGKNQLLKNLYLSMHINEELLTTNPLAETLRISKENPDAVCRIIAYSTFNDKRSIMDTDKVFHRAKIFKDHSSTDELSTLLSVILSNDRTGELIHYFGIDADKDLKARINRIKGDGNSITFGGKSIYGLLIDFACQRYGWTMDYVLWEISYANLTMLSADAITTIYLTDEERKQLGLGFGQVINADDPANRDLIREMISE